MIRVNYLGIHVAFRFVVLLTFTVVLGIILGNTQWLFSQIVLGLIWVILILELIRFIQRNNLIMSRFISNLRYRDFDSVALSGGVRHRAGMVHAMKQIGLELTAFKREQTLRTDLLNQIVQQVEAPIAVFNENDELAVSNVAFTLKMGKRSHLNDFKTDHPELYHTLLNHQVGGQQIRLADENELDAYRVHINTRTIGGQHFRFVTLAGPPISQEGVYEPYQRMLHVLSHEVRNGISPVLSLTETIQDAVNDGNNLQESDLLKALDTIHQQAHHLQNLVERHQQKIQIPPPNKAAIIWGSFFEEMSDVFAGNVQVGGEALNEIAYIDLTQLIQVFTNLYTNAVAFESKTRNLHIDIEVKKTSNEYQIVFRDNGKGVKSELQKDLFLPFVSGREDGVGLGLSICRRIVENHKGRIRLLHSDQNGTSFVIYIPVQ